VEIRKAPAWRFSFWYTAQMDESEKINELQIAAKEYSELLAEYRAKRTQREDIPQASFVTFEGIEEEIQHTQKNILKHTNGRVWKAARRKMRSQCSLKKQRKMFLHG
jgi:hypothetical protein